MRAGDLRHALVIEQQQEARDGFGAVVVTWVAFATVSGSFDVRSGAEVFIAGQQRARSVAEATIRYLPELTSKMRVMFDGAPWNIVHIQPDAKKAMQVLTLEEGLSDGG